MWRDSETEIDYLDYGYIVDIMTDTINDKKLLPSCIGLYGDWGSGKSSLMHMCIKKLKGQNDDTVCLLFNGWLYESYDDAKTAIVLNVPIIPVNGLKTWKKVITKDIRKALWKTANLSVNLVWKNSWICRKKYIPVPNAHVR